MNQNGPSRDASLPELEPLRNVQPIPRGADRTRRACHALLARRRGEAPTRTVLAGPVLVSAAALLYLAAAAERALFVLGR